MIAAIADTHTIVWYLAADSRLSSTAKTFIENTTKAGSEIGISAITFVEMVFLIERGRIPSQRFTQLAQEISSGNSVFVEIPITLALARALSRVDAMQIPDMPDRIIAATALLHKVPVISRDHKIQLSSIKTIW